MISVDKFLFWKREIKPMKLKEILFLIVVFIFFSFPFVMGDGGYFPDDRQIHLYEPNQKTVVLWDRLKETIILSSSVKSDNIANFAWVIPIQSSSKPIVSAGNISIFEELVDYFTPEISYRKGCGIGEGGCAGGGGGVEVIESKEIDIYDITILKANNSNDLINWLNDNGYKFPENVIYYNVYSILDKCVNKYNCYFIANKIDLRNKHKDALDFIDEFVYSRLRKEELPNWIHTLGIAYELYDASSEKDYISERILKSIIYNTSYLDSLWPSPIFISKEEYNDLKEKYSVHFDYNLAKSEVNSILNTKLEKISYIKPKLENLINDLNDLSVGIGTPLKIEFQPDQPYYPLEISRVNTGYTNIEVYVITYYPVKDMNKILDVNGTKDISFDFGRKLEKYVDLKGANYVTRLKYVGYLDNLKNDAIFSNQKAVKKLGEGCQRDDECISNNCDGSWSICCKVNVFCSAIDNQMNCYNKCIEKSVSTTYTTTTFSNQKTKNKLGESCRNNDECISNNCDGSWSICCKSDVHCSPAENQMNCYNKCIEKSVSTTTTTSTIQEIIEKPKPNIFIRIYQRISNFFQKHIRKMV